MRWLAALALSAALPAQAQDARVTDVLRAGGFSGHALLVRGDSVVYDGDVASCPALHASPTAPCRPSPTPDPQRWPWASVSKQMAAIVTLQQVERGKLALDDRIDRWVALPAALPAPTVRQLLQHQSGLRNANDTPPDPATGLPDFYSGGRGTSAWCLRDRKAPGGDWSYNNCDYIVLDRVLKRATGKSVKQLFDSGVARPLGLTRTAYLSGANPDEPLGKRTARLFAGWGAGGALAGPPADLLAIDRALLAGTLLKRESRAILWEGNPKLGYMALGQWAFAAPLKGCKGTVRIIERRGSIDVTQVRNIILPDLGVIAILFTNQGEDRFDFGEIWQGKGLSHDLLAALACP